jgi:hypothetical protein
MMGCEVTTLYWWYLKIYILINSILQYMVLPWFVSRLPKRWKILWNFK